jgi:hypothetical protein
MPLGTELPSAGFSEPADAPTADSLLLLSGLVPFGLLVAVLGVQPIHPMVRNRQKHFRTNPFGLEYRLIFDNIEASSTEGK